MCMKENALVRTAIELIQLRKRLEKARGELRRLVESGVSEKATALQAIGYKELLGMLRGECTLEEAKASIQLLSRRYAKRQLTWFRRNPDVHWIEAEAPWEEIFLTARQYVTAFDSTF